MINLKDPFGTTSIRDNSLDKYEMTYLGLCRVEATGDLPERNVAIIRVPYHETKTINGIQYPTSRILHHDGICDRKSLEERAQTPDAFCREVYAHALADLISAEENNKDFGPPQPISRVKNIAIAPSSITDTNQGQNHSVKLPERNPG